MLGIDPADAIAAAGRKLHLAPRLLAASGELDASSLRLEHMHDRGLERWFLVHLEAVRRRGAGHAPMGGQRRQLAKGRSRGGLRGALARRQAANERGNGRLDREIATAHPAGGAVVADRAPFAARSEELHTPARRRNFADDRMAGRWSRPDIEHVVELDGDDPVGPLAIDGPGTVLGRCQRHHADEECQNCKR